LQIIGLYYSGSRGSILRTFKELHNAQLFLPIIFTLGSGGGIHFYHHVSIFPAFYSVDRRATISQVLAQSFCKDQGDFMRAKAENIFYLSIYLIDSSDMPSIYALAKAIVVSFPQIAWSDLWFERPCEIVSFLLTIDDYNCI
jgi:hypothetical protein